MPHFRNIIWDWNGTLVDDAQLAVDAVNEMLRRREKPQIDLEFYREVYTHPAENMYAKIGFDRKRETFETLCNEWYNHYSVSLLGAALHHDALETIRFFRTAGKSQAILSALSHDLLETCLTRHGIDTYFEYISGLGDRFAKGKTENGRLLMQTLGWEREETVLIGDSAHDAEVAAELGARCILVGRGLDHPRRLKEQGVPVFEDFISVMEHLVPHPRENAAVGR